MWRKKKTQLEKNFDHTLSQITNFRHRKQDYEKLRKKIYNTLGECEIPLPDKLVFRVESRSWSIKSEFDRHTTIKIDTDSITDVDMEKFSIEMIQQAFIKWAENKFKIGFPSLVGE